VESPLWSTFGLTNFSRSHNHNQNQSHIHNPHSSWHKPGTDLAATSIGRLR